MRERDHKVVETRREALTKASLGRLLMTVQLGLFAGGLFAGEETADAAETRPGPVLRLYSPEAHDEGPPTSSPAESHSHSALVDPSAVLRQITELLARQQTAAPGHPDKTLRDAWAALRRMRIQKRTTQDEYERCLDRFEAFWGASNRTISPVAQAGGLLPGSPGGIPCGLVDEAALADFRDWLGQQKTVKGTAWRATNIAKHFRPLKALLNEAAAQGWIARPPRKPAIAKVAAKPITFIRPELVSQFVAQVDAHPPAWPPRDFSRGVTPATWWRGAVTLLWHYGLRRCELFGKLTWRHRDPELGELGVFFQQESPLPGIDLRSEQGWLVYAPEKQQWAKPGSLLLPLTRACRAALEAIKREQGLGPTEWPHTLVFPGPASHPARDRVLKQLREGAGIGLHFTFHDFRKTCETFWNGVEPTLGTFVTGHAGRTVSDQSYDQKLVRLLALLPGLESRGDYPRAFV